MLGVPLLDPSPAPERSRHAVQAVLFDFHGTVAQVEDAVDWVLAAASACGAILDLSLIHI